jgi:hypothetical protein
MYDHKLIEVVQATDDLCRFYALPVGNGMLRAEKMKAYMKFIGCNDDLVRKVLDS